MRFIPTNDNRRRRGQAVLLVTFALTMMLAMLSFAVDLGWGYYRREVAQAAADSAATAAVRAVTSGTPSCGSGIVWCGSPAGTVTNCPATAPTTATNTYDNACMLAAANGYTTTGSRTVSVQANTTTPHLGAAVSYWVTVSVTETPATFFGVPIGLHGLSGLSVNVQSSAALISNGVSANAPCIYILGSTGNTLALSNGISLTASSCGVYVNSSNTSSSSGGAAVTVVGGSRLNTPVLDIVGGDTVNNGGAICTSSGTCTTLTPTTGASAAADPFSSLPAPSNPGSCTTGSWTTAYATAQTINPGCYNGFTMSNGASLILNSGTYYINGGVFSLQGGGTLTATSGVMIYLTGGAYVNMGNGTTANMVAQSSGTYEGILFYQDRSVSSPTGSIFEGGNNSTFQGALYFPKANLTWNNGTTANTVALVVNSLTLAGGAVVSQATSQTQTGLPVAGNSTAILQ